MPSQEHDLKLATEYFDAVANGDKSFEVRRDDRGFQKGDVLILRRFGKSWVTQQYSYLKGTSGTYKTEADTALRRVTYVLTGGQFGIEPGYVVMGLEPTDP